jgi:hypothetical protein
MQITQQLLLLLACRPYGARPQAELHAQKGAWCSSCAANAYSRAEHVARLVSQGARRIGFREFMAALPLMAEDRGISVEEVRSYPP